ncbi:efflux RND transporter periplasmic adaptor subunit [Actimicrobium sp. CCI2.3]|uniref:efflux RND transporter periplasmic adaptor subunit n=1 Tax=Actimicrobium sp. CCI2.3 TaxID=3048616 RepID=UPI002AB4A0BD|nr:efflux RND transporter periplasmic adaptor subunit [Actimicrobium sp. CCI2.3]MDY7575206.1 efflux RND transporter periplasmic adaptor subunit [Actimicrobium sp. CCI2.3]MEB0022331.1 efflux RND transporter periplasmic adaptor subunit [Actimicrobium sp. CCI2.3]
MTSRLNSCCFSATPMASVMLALVLLAACSKPVEKTDDIRPVRAMKLVAADADATAEFSGDVRPRIESRLGFRVGGKIVARKVEVGSLVKRGQVLMQLDPQDFELAQLQSAAGLKAAQSNRDLALAEQQRYVELRARNFVSQAVLDAKQTAFQAAQASFDQAAAVARNQINQTGYTTLVANVDGVVTGIDAEAGQVVAAGTPVLRVAQTREKDVVIGIPEDQVELLRQVGTIRVHIWADPGTVIEGKLRELSPIADPVSRTFTARIALPSEAAQVRLGMTAYVTFVSKVPQGMIRVPLNALVRDKPNTAVWVIDKGAVSLVPVQVAGPAGNDMLLSGGVSAGQVIVIAGVNLLKSGQKVTILNDDLAVRDAVSFQGGASK